jgi:hypothetical protein
VQLLGGNVVFKIVYVSPPVEFKRTESKENVNCNYEDKGDWINVYVIALGTYFRSNTYKNSNSK